MLALDAFGPAAGSGTVEALAELLEALALRALVLGPALVILGWGQLGVLSHRYPPVPDQRLLPFNLSVASFDEPRLFDEPGIVT